MLIREAAAGDWQRIWPFWHRIVAAGETYTWDRDTSEEAARSLWMNPAKRVYVAEDTDGALVGTAYLTPNYGGPAAGIFPQAPSLALSEKWNGLDVSGRKWNKHSAIRNSRFVYSVLAFCIPGGARGGPSRKGRSSG